MLGRSHLITGACGFLGVVVPAAAGTGTSLTPAEIACGTLVASGAAMLPDLDHPQATVSRSLGPVSWFASRLISRLAGGHRNGTHSLLAVALVAVATNGLVLSNPGNLWIPFALSFLCVSLVCRVLLDAQNDVTSALCAAVLSAGLIAVTPDFSWLGIAITTGYALHLAGDAITKEGVPLLWPLNRTRFKVAAITTGGRMERGVALVSGLLVAAMAWSLVLSPAIAATHGATAPAAHRAERAHPAAAAPTAAAGVPASLRQRAHKAAQGAPAALRDKAQQVAEGTRLPRG